VPRVLTSAVPAPLLSAAMIVRDEEAMLGACLESIGPFVDEIVVVDTGSTDRTQEIALAHGARLFHHPWTGDFAAARNAALERAAGAWILYIDADERARLLGDVRVLLAEADEAVAGRVRFRAQNALTRYREFRLFRNRPDIRFRGVIHETMLPDVDRIVAAGRGAVVEVPLEIDHVGYEGDRTRKHRRDLPLLERAVRENPGRLYLWHALGAARQGMEQPELAREAWQRGLEVLRRLPGAPPEGLLLLASLANHAHGRRVSAAAEAEEARVRYPDHPLGHWIRAREALLFGDLTDAVALLERLVAVDPDAFVDASLGLDRRMFRDAAYEMLGACALRMGESTRALHWFDLALREAPPEAHAALALKRRLAKGRLRAAAGSR
jgi:glycosyltransferase involved in cell wall biosynthesis